jgi:hypothetical protein
MQMSEEIASLVDVTGPCQRDEVLKEATDCPRRLPRPSIVSASEEVRIQKERKVSAGIDVDEVELML